MKPLLTLAICGLLALTARADVTLRSAYFTPGSGDISLYITEEGFARSAPVALASLTESQQSAVQTALDWLATQLPAGLTTLDRVILELGAPVPVSWDEEDQPTAWTRSLSAAVFGSGPKGGRTVIVADAPPEIRAALLALWDSLEASLAD